MNMNEGKRFKFQVFLVVRIEAILKSAAFAASPTDWTSLFMRFTYGNRCGFIIILKANTPLSTLRQNLQSPLTLFLMGSRAPATVSGLGNSTGNASLLGTAYWPHEGKESHTFESHDSPGTEDRSTF